MVLALSCEPHEAPIDAGLDDGGSPGTGAKVASRLSNEMVLTLHLSTHSEHRGIKIGMSSVNGRRPA